jgi:glutathione-regulated potassium-efflux system ancillary protein KefG
MSRILILFAHPRYENSIVQQQLALAAQRVRGVTFHDLYELYPDFDIQVKLEQELLMEHEIVVLQHPFYWYSCPPLMKQWIDLVLEHGWAYGKEGRSLEGKKLFNVISTGGRQEAYHPGGFNRFTIPQFLAPFEQTARICNMMYYPPLVVHGTHRGTLTEMENAGEGYRNLLEGLVNDKFPVEDIVSLNYMNELIN